MDNRQLGAWIDTGEKISLEEFSSFFKKFNSSAFRLETLPSYQVAHEDKHFAAYLRGDANPPFIYQDWKNTIANATTEGRSFEIIRIVPDPLTTYFKYELEWHYLEYKSVGQDTRFIFADKAAQELGIAAELDFWLFDDQIAVAIKYDDNGDVKGLFKISDPSLINYLCNIRDKARLNSISLDEYLPLYKATINVQYK